MPTNVLVRRIRTELRIAIVTWIDRTSHRHRRHRRQVTLARLTPPRAAPGALIRPSRGVQSF